MNSLVPGHHRAVQPGDVVSVPVDAGLLMVDHFGVVVECHPRYGARVVSNSKKLGQVTEESWHDFGYGAELLDLHENLVGTLPWFEVVARAREQIGRPYSLWADNCEHFVRHAHGLLPESPQLARGIARAVVGGVAVVGGAAVVGGLAVALDALLSPPPKKKKKRR